MARGKYKRKRHLRERRLCFIKDSGISARVANVLINAGIETMADLDLRTEDEIMQIPGIGEKAMEEIRPKHCCVKTASK